MTTTATPQMPASMGGASRGETDDRIVLAHGGGGELMGRLIREHIFAALGNQTLASLTDGAVLPPTDGRLVFTTDSFVVQPLEFPGGDIGRLAVCGTVNDLAVMGARPLYLSLGLILEEGLSIALLDRVLDSIATAAREAGVQVVTGDTKVIERRSMGESADGMFINTAGIGTQSVRAAEPLDARRIRPGDAILINGPIAEHGLSILSRRSGIDFDSALRSDAAPLNHLIARLLESGTRVRFLRDATRGGVAGVLADITDSADVSIELEERHLPIGPTARHAAEMLGLDVLSVANEGKIIAVVAGTDLDRALSAMREDPLGRNAACIGFVTGARPPLVELKTRAGGRRIVQRSYGEELPRIC